jgi:hypothetical protein
MGHLWCCVAVLSPEPHLDDFRAIDQWLGNWSAGKYTLIPGRSRLHTLTGVVFQNAIVPVWATETAEHTSRGKRKNRTLDNFELACEQPMLCC